jgi:16S rRNA (guanine527-N7)-methyltransferase
VPRLSLGPREARHLAEGAAALGVALDEEGIRRFSAFAHLLESWGARVNLISCREPAELVERHFLDSLAASRGLAGAQTIVDLGSGAGFPGVPLAIAGVDRRTVLVEPRRRRANFLREVRRALALPKIEVIEVRASDEHAAKAVLADAAVFRAVWPGSEGLHEALPWIRDGGRILHMRSGARPISFAPEAPTIRGILQLERSIEYRIGRGLERTIDVYRSRVD